MLRTIGLQGFKSLYGTGSVPFGRLTILAGTNSSGKSALMQPLLLMKQTLESPFDPGPLLLEGPNIRITSAEQVLSKQRTSGEDRFSLIVDIEDAPVHGSIFRKGHGGFILASQSISNRKKGDEKGSATLSEGEKLSFKSDKVAALSALNSQVKAWSEITKSKRPGLPVEFVALRDRCLLGLALDFPGPDNRSRSVDVDITPALSITLRNMIHVPGLRGNPARDYKTTAVGKSFPGTFDNYVASVIHLWQNERSAKLQDLNRHMDMIGLNSNVRTDEVLDTRVAIEVSRMPSSRDQDSGDRVSIADVGLGVSQILPFLVAMLVAKRDQIVYVEQPELHLHPASQYKLAGVIAEAIAHGVQVVMETHSAILLRGLQTAVASGAFKPREVVLNWFSRNMDNGSTKVDSKVLGLDGAVGDWPSDFDDVMLHADSEYLDAAIRAVTVASESEDLAQ